MNPEKNLNELWRVLQINILIIMLLGGRRARSQRTRYISNGCRRRHVASKIIFIKWKFSQKSLRECAIFLWLTPRYMDTQTGHDIWCTRSIPEFLAHTKHYHLYKYGAFNGRTWKQWRKKDIFPARNFVFFLIELLIKTQWNINK